MDMLIKHLKKFTEERNEKLMNIGSIGSLIFGFVILIVAFVMEGGKPSSLLQVTAAMIVFGGTIAAVGLSFPVKTLVKFPKVISVVFKNEQLNRDNLVDTFVSLSQKVRTEGFLVLERDLQENYYDPFLSRGLQMIVDGMNPELIKKALENNIVSIDERHQKAAQMFEAAGGYSPTMGIIGTVMGLVQVLSNLSEPAALGEKIAVAFIATLYGVGFANLVWLPIANRLKQLNEEELVIKEMMLEGILLLQEGANVNTMKESLYSFMNKQAIPEREL